MNNFKQNILSKIKTGEVDMKPRWHFVLKSLLFILGIITVTLVAVYLLSFILFALRQNGVGFAPLYGFRGISIFIMSSPWLLIASTGAFISILYILISRYSFSYQKPLVYSMIGVVLLALLSSLLIQQTGMHRHLQQFSERNNVPVFTPLYKGVDRDHPENVTVGTITEMTDEGFIIESDQGDKLNIIITEATKQRPGSTYAVDQNVFIFGERTGDTITSFGVRPTPKDKRMKQSKHSKPDNVEQL
jgi:hypothetical protein